MSTKKNFHMEYRIVWPDQSIRWISSRADLYRDAEGKPVRMAGSVTDITEKKDAPAPMNEYLMPYF